jgi:addiction module RelE/StbE family toxin
MKIKYHKEFVKNYKKRIESHPKLVKKFKEQLEKFIDNPSEPSVRDHKLIGKKQDFRAFSVTGDIRVVYKIVSGELWLYDIGSHNQIY